MYTATSRTVYTVKAGLEGFYGLGVGMKADNQTSLNPEGAVSLKCAWHKCGKEFIPAKKGQRFCPGGKCKDAHNNWLKMTGHHLIPRIELKLQKAAGYLEKPVDQFLNEIVDMAIPTAGISMSEDEIKGINEITLSVGEEGSVGCHE